MKWPQMSLDATKWHVKFQNFSGGRPPKPPYERVDTPPLVPSLQQRAPMACLLAFGQLGKCFIFNLGKTLSVILFQVSRIVDLKCIFSMMVEGTTGKVPTGETASVEGFYKWNNI